MGRIASAAVVALVALSPVVAAQAAVGSAPDGWSAARFGAVPGGRYVAHLRPRNGVEIHLRFTMANDGREFAKPSTAAIDAQCTRNAGASDDFNLSNVGEEFRSVQVRHGGRFRYRAYGYRLAGRFVDRGRLAVGTVSFPRLERGCPRVTARFRARLKGRPNVSRPGVPVACDPVIVSSSDSGDLGDGSYAAVEQGIGCTTAREFARRWNASRTCMALATGASCAIAGGECQAIAGGRFRALAGARCSPAGKPTRTVELVQSRPCVAPKTHAETFRLWAINLPCQTATAFPIEELGLDESSGQDTGAACSPPPALEFGEHKTCRPLAGFTCTVSVRDFGPVTEGFRGRCREDEKPFQALQFDYILG